MTTRQASFATGLSLILEIAVTTVLLRPVSLTNRNLIRNPVGSMICVGAIEAVVGAPLTEQCVDELIAITGESIGLQQQPAPL